VKSQDQEQEKSMKQSFREVKVFHRLNVLLMNYVLMDSKQSKDYKLLNHNNNQAREKQIF
jgi:hypothetical protein